MTKSLLVKNIWKQIKASLKPIEKYEAQNDTDGFIWAKSPPGILKVISVEAIDILDSYYSFIYKQNMHFSKKIQIETLSPFALLIALNGLKTLKTLRIFTTDIALDLDEK